MRVPLLLMLPLMVHRPLSCRVVAGVLGSNSKRRSGPPLRLLVESLLSYPLPRSALSDPASKVEYPSLPSFINRETSRPRTHARNPPFPYTFPNAR